MSGKVLSACVGCVHAEWDKTRNGRRHPNGEGRCTFQFPETSLPKWVRNPFATWRREQPAFTLDSLLSHYGGVRFIYYHETHRTEPEACDCRVEWEP